ncbi:MAG: tetratricopeptide repeat protein [Candidatus Acidiferrales bacterium]
MSKLPLRFLVLALLAFPLISSPTLAQRGGGSPKPLNERIIVQVRYPDGTAAANGVLVELEYQNTQMIMQDQTDSSGKVNFSPPGPAIYLVRAKQAGYEDAVQSLDLQNSPTGMAMLTLRPKPGEAPPQPPKDATGSTVSAIDLSVPELARKEYDAGQQAIEANDIDGGVAHLKKAIELHDQFPQAYTLLGMAYNAQKKWKDAQGALEKAVQQDPKAVEAYFLLGASLNQQNDHAGAIKALNRGLELNSDAHDVAAAHYELARAYMAQGQWQNANPHAAKAVAMQPDQASWHILMGNIDLKKGDGQGAICEFQAYLKLEPNGSAAASIHDLIPKIQAAIQKKQ